MDVGQRAGQAWRQLAAGLHHARSRGGFYGWPWYYIGGHQDPRLAGKHPELKAKTIVPDVLIQPHNASLGITFAPDGDLFAAEHGSWNRAAGGYEDS